MAKQSDCPIWGEGHKAVLHSHGIEANHTQLVIRILASVGEGPVWTYREDEETVPWAPDVGSLSSQEY